MLNHDDKLDDERQPVEQRAETREEASAPSETRNPLTAQLAEEEIAAREQAPSVATLQQELDQARSRNTEAAQAICLLERERDAILAELRTINQSVGFRLIKHCRRLKDRLLPPGTTRRRLYNRWHIRVKGSPAPPANRAAPQPALQDPGPAQPALPADFYRAQLAWLHTPTALVAGQAETMRVSVTNLSSSRWEASSKEPIRRGIVRLSYHWYDENEKLVQWDGERTNLPGHLEPGGTATVGVKVFAPFDPGTYTLEITLVHEGMAWFEEKGSAGLRASVVVEPSKAGSRQFPSCSIVVPALNRSAFTKACLLAIEKSVPVERLPYEIIVVDNGSTDETPGLLAAWSRTRPNARVVTMGRNLGFARACNEGARLARGQYIVFLNNDTLPTPGWLENMVSLARSEAGIGIVGSKLLFPNGRIQHVGVVFDEHKNPQHIYRGFPADIPPANISREYQAVTGACLLMGRDLYWSVGGMDEMYENSYEDADLCLKIRRRGYRLLVCASSIVYHFESSSEGRFSSDFRNRAIFKVRWESSIHSDMDNRYSMDGLEGEPTEFEAHEGYDPKQERQLERLWKRVYAGPLPKRGFVAG